MSHVLLPRSERVRPRTALLGPAHADQAIRLTVKLRRKKPIGELPRRPAVILSHDEVAQQFGAEDADARAVIDCLTRLGLVCETPNLAARTIGVHGTVAKIERAFGVRLMRFAHAASAAGFYRGRVGNIRVPSEIANIVEGVFGLDNRPAVKPRRALRHPLDVGYALCRRPHPWFFPSELANLYSFPPGDGYGQVVAVLEFGGGYFPGDMGVFATQAKIGLPSTRMISVDGTPTNARDGAEGEVMLDFEVLAGLLPRGNLVGLFAAWSEQGWLDALDQALHDPSVHPSVISISWGDSEDGGSWTPAAINQVNESLKEAALMGVTVCVAAGDDGSDDQVGDGYAHCDFPASSPYVLAVGGTTLHRNAQGAIASEVAWHDGDGLRADGGGSTGGGVSGTFARPDWQNGVSIDSVNPGAPARWQ